MEKNEIVGKGFSGNASLVTAILEDNKDALLCSQIEAHLIEWLDPSILDKNATLLAACEILRRKYSKENNESTVEKMQVHELIAAANTASRQVFPLLYRLEQEIKIFGCMSNILEAQQDILRMHSSSMDIDAADANIKYLAKFLQIIYESMLSYTDSAQARDYSYIDRKIIKLDAKQIIDEAKWFYNVLITRPWVIENKTWGIENKIIPDQIKKTEDALRVIEQHVDYFLKRKTELCNYYQEFCKELQNKARKFMNNEIVSKLGHLMGSVDIELLDRNDIVEHTSITGGRSNANFKIDDAHVLDVMIRQISDEIEFNIIIGEFPKHIKSASNLLMMEGKNTLLLRSKVPINMEQAIEILEQTKKQADVCEALYKRGMTGVELYSAISSNPYVELNFAYFDDESAMRIAAARKDAAKAERELEKNARTGNVNRGLSNKESVAEMPTISGGKSTPITGPFFL